MIVLATVLFPVPAAPISRNIFGLSVTTAHDRISRKRSTRVSCKHLGLFASCSGTVMGLSLSLNSKIQLGFYRDDSESDSL